VERIRFITSPRMMGGMGFIEHNKALCMLSVLINTQMLEAAQKYRAQKFFLFFLSVRLQRRQAARHPPAPGSRRGCYPALAEDGYGLGKAV